MKHFIAASVLASTAACFSAKAATNQFAVTASSSQNYTINGATDPELTLVRGFTYFFNVSVASSHPFYIKTDPITGFGSAYNTGVTGQGVTSGTLEFQVPNGAPDTLHYICSNHINMTAALHIIDPPAVSITDFSVGTNLVFQSTGSDTLNLNVQTRSNLTNAWSSATNQSNQFADGTNTTHVSLPAGDSAFFQIQQGFF